MSAPAIRVGTLPLLLAALLVVGGCANDHDDLKAWMAGNTQNLKGHIPPLPAVKPYEPAQYDPASLPDPFRVSKLEPEGRKGGGASKFAPDFAAREARNNELERYPLESLRMIGYLKIGPRPYAVIQVDQKIKQVKLGDYLGQDFGIVTDIKESELAVRELVQDSSGDWVERTNTLLLQESTEGKK